MARGKYSPYFTRSDGALGKLGNGFRRVEAKVMPKWVMVRAYGMRIKIARPTWDNDVKKVPDEGQSFGEILAAFKQGENCNAMSNSLLKGAGRRQTRRRAGS